MAWKHNATVVSVIKQDFKFLLVEKHHLLFNQPASRLESNESLQEAVVREVLEESAYEFEPQYLIDIYRWQTSAHDTTYLHFAFAERVLAHYPERTLDADLVRTTLDNRGRNLCQQRSPP